MATILKKIGEIEISGNVFHVAKNGKYELVWQSGEDAYGTPIYMRYDLKEAHQGNLHTLCEDLIQAVGKLLSEKQAVADSRRAKIEGSSSVDG